MASYCLFMKDEKEFYQKLREREPDLILKMAKAVINATKKKREQIDIFNITFKNGDELTFSIEKHDYLNLLKNLIDDLVQMDQTETYLMCAEIQKLSKPKRKYTKNAKAEI